jgi:DNA polymerase-2
MTLNGPVPVQNEIGHIDYQHYIERQIRPIADQVLRTMGMDFDSLEMGDQLSLF